MTKKIVVLSGDGIGPEIMDGAIAVLKDIEMHFDHSFLFCEKLIGGIAIDETGNPLPEDTISSCKEADGILLGAVGGPKWDQNSPELRPEKGLLKIRKELGLFANVRPVLAFNSLLDSSTLKEEVIKDVDLVIIRELTGGLYFGTPSERRIDDNGEEVVVDTLFYRRSEIERIIRKGFEVAQHRAKKLVSVDKANVLESSRLWRQVAEEVAVDFPDVTLEHMLVDNAAMQLIRRPSQFDVIVTENLFGDILSDEASMLTGSLGMLPSASLSQNGPGLYEPIHGSAPDIAGKGVANPIAMILSAAMMLRTSFLMFNEANLIEKAVQNVLNAGYRTADLSNQNPISTKEMISKIREEIASEAMSYKTLSTKS